MSTPQGLALAVSPNGINYFAQNVVGAAILQAINTVTLPSKTINPPSVELTSTRYSQSYAQDIAITLSGGKLTAYNPQFQQCTQNPSGSFVVAFVATNCNATFNWNEKYADVFYMGFSHHTISNPSNNYPYNMGIGTLTIDVPLTLSTTPSGGYELTVGTVTATPAGLDANIPSKSVIVQTYGACFGTTVNSATVASIENIDFASPIQTDVNPLFGTIADSGTLLPSPTQIVYEYGVGASPLVFPAAGGLTLGVTGEVTYQGTAYSGEAAPDVAVPTMPSAQHLAFNLADFEFNALYWAFFEAGKLATDVTPGDLPDQAMLQTATYKGTYLQALYSAYPSVPMSVEVTATSAPTLFFQQVYILTSAALTSLASKAVPSAVLTPLKVIENEVFLQQSQFVAKVEQHSPNSTPYINQIESAAQTDGALTSHDVNCVFNVVPASTAVPVFTVQFNETDFLYDLQLGVAPSSGTPSKQAQTVKFAFQLINSETTAQLVSSNIPGITSSGFPMMWNIVLQPEYADEMAAMGKQGVPLPFIQGFQFLFDGAAVQVQPGSVNVVTDVEYKGGTLANA